MQTNDKQLVDLMKDIHAGKIQLPDFQRGWIGMMRGFVV